MKRVTMLAAVALVATLPSLALAEGIPVSTDKAPAAIGPYSQAVWADKTLYLSGQLGLVPATGKLAEGGTLKQAEQIFKNIKAILESQGLDFKDIVKITVYGMDIKEFPEVNKLYATFFPKNPPARAFVQVSALPAGGAIELDVIAYKSK